LQLLNSTHDLSRVGEALVGIHERKGWTTMVLVAEQGFWRQGIDGTERGAIPRAGTACPTLPGAQEAGRDPRAAKVRVDLADDPLQGPVPVTPSETQRRLRR
jgi:hypothetical protein